MDAPLPPVEDEYDVVGVKHVGVMEDLLRRHVAGDPDAYTHAMDPAIVVVQPSSTPFGGAFHGIAGVEAMNARLAEHWSRQWNWNRRQPAGRYVVNHEAVRWHAVATGREVVLETVSLYRFRDRRIARIDVFTQDTAQLLATLA